MKTEELEGYLVDIACIRKYSRDELLERAEQHPRECALMGHCIESGYGLLSSDGAVHLLDAGATPAVVSTVRKSPKASGIQPSGARAGGGGPGRHQRRARGQVGASERLLRLITNSEPTKTVDREDA